MKDSMMIDPCHPLAFANEPAVVLHEEEADNMVSDWVDYLIAARSVSGEWSVYARKWMEEFIDGGYERVWVDIDDVSGVKTADEFLKAIRRCEISLNVDVDPEYVVKQVTQLDAAMAEQLAELF